MKQLTALNSLTTNQFTGNSLNIIYTWINLKKKIFIRFNHIVEQYFYTLV